MLDSEQRQSTRKVLKVKALLMMEGAETVLGRTVDVAGDGVCLLLGNSLKPGTIGTVRFEIFHEGKATSITARSRVQYCILSSGEYKIGFQFVNLELSAMASLARFLR
ncbi:MAG: PilZ domain-containing protein [Massilia sp.]